jgi:ribosome-interacting GTPase 1
MDTATSEKQTNRLVEEKKQLAEDKKQLAEKERQLRDEKLALRAKSERMSVAMIGQSNGKFTIERLF